MKIFLVTTSAPYCGTDQHYAAYANDSEDVYNYLYENWFDEECQMLWDSYSFRNEDTWEEEWEELDEVEKEEVYDNNFDNFMDNKYEEWCSDCGLEVSEVKDEEELDMYVPGGEGHLEIIYDERKNEK